MSVFLCFSVNWVTLKIVFDWWVNLIGLLLAKSDLEIYLEILMTILRWENFLEILTENFDWKRGVGNFLKLGLCFSVSSGQPNVELFGYYVRFHVGKLMHLWMKYVTFPCSVTCLDLLFAHWLESEKEIIFVSVSIDNEHWRKLCSHFWFLRRKVLV